jgi:L-ascorbate metabolism protein UlaG (beta-lactamase superfamily)
MSKKIFLAFLFIALVSVRLTPGEKTFESEVIETNAGPLKITFIGHATLMFTFNKMTIHVDPFSRMADYTKLPKADLVLITHHHGDHLDPAAVEKIKTGKTKIILTKKCGETVTGGIIMANGDIKTVNGLKIEAVAAYNLVHKRGSGDPFHPKGEGNGYVITFGDKRVYVAGDTENTPEMKNLKNIEAAFLPMNLPYTMTPEMVVDAVKAFKPKILFPYHFAFGNTDLPKLETLMKDVKEVKLRIHNKK